MSGVRVEVTRGGLVESVHDVDVAVTRGADVVARAGAPDRVSFARSAVKLFQAVPLVEDGVVDRFGFSDEELALACASHGGEPRHVAAARSMLEKAGVPESALACGPHAPLHDAAAASLTAAGEAPGRVHNNCSGKHAGMLALAVAHDWPVAGYQDPEHPVQQRMLAEVARWTGESAASIGTAVDGCGVVTFAVSVEALGRAFGRFAAAVRDGEPGPVRVATAMRAHPFMVAGTDRLGTRLVEVTDGRVLAKVGAEGVFGAAVPAEGLGVALKVRDGARRAGGVALLGVLEAMGLLAAGERDALAAWGRPTIRNTRDEVVGEIRAAVSLGDAGAGGARG